VRAESAYAVALMCSTLARSLPSTTVDEHIRAGVEAVHA